MNAVIENMISRRSVKAYKPDMVPMELIEEVVKAGTYAPTGMNMQSPVIVAVVNKKVRDHLSRMNASIMGTSSDLFMMERLLWATCSTPHTRSVLVHAGYIAPRKSSIAKKARRF